MRIVAESAREERVVEELAESLNRKGYEATAENAHGMSRVGVEVERRAEYPQERVEAIRRAVGEHFTCPVTLIFVRNDDTDFTAEVTRRGKKARLEVNTAGTILEKAFRHGGSHVDAIVEHEACHLNDFEWHYSDLVAPKLLELGGQSHEKASKMLTGVYHGALEDTVAIALMSDEGARRFLGLLCETLWKGFLGLPERRYLKATWMIRPVMARAVSKFVPDFDPVECGYILEKMVKDSGDWRVHDAMDAVFTALADAVKKDVKEVDLRRESVGLAEATYYHRAPWM